ncbi:phage tail tape measure protein [Carnimonas bestiolae]|uniref:phage tail tape measure protein n=1 Tax=Carnimonas bestiolae TaxID=3402172 RepID=UPI003EDBC10F
MAERKSRLSVEVDAGNAQSQIEALKARLQALEQAGLRATTATKTTGEAASSSGDKASASGSKWAQLMKELQRANQSLSAIKKASAAAGQATQSAGESASASTGEFAGLTAQVGKLDQGLAAVVAATTRVDQSVTTLSNSTLRAAEKNASAFQAALDKIAAAQGRVRKSTSSSATSIEGQKEELAELIGKIDPVIGRLDKLDKQEAQLRQHLKQGILPQEDFERFKATLDNSRSAITRYTADAEGLAKAHWTVGREAQLAAPQITDIVTSLVSGQPAYMVAIQQGGQLKDVFGGLGNAARGVGIAIRSMINPFTVALAVLGTVGAAAYQGANEMGGLNKELIKTGRYSESLSAQLSTSADQIAKASSTTRGQAIGALTEVAKSGKIAESQYSSVAQAALAYSRASGESISSVVDQYASLEGAPTRAVKTLNDSLHFLTASEYQEISALEQSGDTMAATQKATELLAKAHQQRSAEMVEQAGLIEKAWHNVKGAISDTWDYLKGIGRDDGIAGQLSKAQQNLADAQQRLQDAKQSGGFVGPAQQDVDRFQSVVNSIQGVIDATTGGYDALKKNQQAMDDYGIKAVDVYNKVTDKADTYAEKVKKARKEAEALVPALERAGSIKGDKDREKFINDYVRDKAGKEPKAPKTNNRELRRQVSLLSQQRKGLSSLIQPLGQADQAQTKYQSRLTQINEALKKGNIINVEATVARVKAAADYNKESEAARRASQQVERYNENLKFQLELQQQQNDLQVAGVGMGAQELQRAQEELQIRQQSAQRIKQLNDQRNLPGINTDYIDKEIELERRAADGRIAMQRRMYDQMDEMQDNWLNGVQSGWADYKDAAAKTSDQSKQLFTTATQDMTDAMAKFVTTGKLDFGNLADTIVQEMAKIAIQRSILGLTKMLGGDSGGGISSAGFGAASLVTGVKIPGWSKGGYTGDGPKYEVAGAVHKGEGVITQEGMKKPGAFEALSYLNGARGYAEGGYVGDRALPQLPQRRNEAPAASGDIHFSPTVHVDARGSSDPAAVQEAAQRGAQMAWQRIQDDARRNGPLTQRLRKVLR